MTATGWNRREFVRAAALLGLALGTPGCVTAAALDPAQAPSEDDLAFITRIADMVIPATDTPGAAEAGVGAFVLLALAHGLDGARAPLASAAVTASDRQLTCAPMAASITCPGSAQSWAVTRPKPASPHWMPPPLLATPRRTRGGSSRR